MVLDSVKAAKENEPTKQLPNAEATIISNLSIGTQLMLENMALLQRQNALLAASVACLSTRCIKLDSSVSGIIEVRIRIIFSFFFNLVTKNIQNSVNLVKSMTLIFAWLLLSFNSLIKFLK